MWGFGFAGCRLFAAGVIVAIAAMPVRADLADWPETSAMLSAPDQPKAVYAFVNRAVEAERLSEAANALERLVRFRPDLVQARRDLIRLYDAIGAGDLAAEQRQALADAGESDIPDADASASVSGYVAVGFGYDTNPAATPREDVLTFFSPTTQQVFEVDLGLERDDSPLAFVQAGARVSAPVRDDVSFIVDLSAYGAHFFEDDDQDDALASARAGPEFALDGAAVRPFVEVGYRHFGGDPYAVAGAVGLEGRAAVGAGFLRFELAGGFRDYIPTSDTPGRENLDGAEARASIGYGMALDDIFYLDVAASAALVDAARDFEDYYAFGADAALYAQFEAMGRALTATVGAGVLHSRYDAPNFQLLNIARRDTSVSAYASLAMELDDATSIDGAVSLRRRYSNYDIYDNEGLRLTLRLLRRF